MKYRRLPRTTIPLCTMPGTAVSPPVAEARGKTRWWQALPLDRAGLVLGPLLMLGWLTLTDRGGLTPEAHTLARRLALRLLCTRWAGRSPGTLLAAVGVAVTFISMWISNTAAAAMMCPVAAGIVAVLAAGRTPAAGDFAKSPFASALLLITAF